MTSRKRSEIGTSWSESCIDSLSNKTLSRLLLNRTEVIRGPSKTKQIMINHLQNECDVDIDEKIIKQLPVKAIIAELELKGLSTEKASKSELMERYLNATNESNNNHNDDIQQPPTKKQRISRSHKRQNKPKTFTTNTNNNRNNNMIESKSESEDESQCQSQSQSESETDSKEEGNNILRTVWNMKPFKWSKVYNKSTNDLKEISSKINEKLENVWWNNKIKINETREKYILGELLDGDNKYYQHYHIRPVGFINRLPMKQVPGLEFKIYDDENDDINNEIYSEIYISITDFDIISKNGEEIECRLEIWEGDADISTGCYGRLIHRITGEILANIYGSPENYGNNMSLIKCNLNVIEEYESDEYNIDVENDFDLTYDSGVYIAHGNLINKCLKGIIFVINDDIFDKYDCNSLVTYYGGIINNEVTSKCDYLIVSYNNINNQSKKYQDAKKYKIEIIDEYELKEFIDEEIDKYKYDLKNDTYLNAIYQNGYEFERIIGVAINLDLEIIENPKIFQTYWPMALRIDFSESKIINVIKSIVGNNNGNNSNNNNNTNYENGNHDTEIVSILKSIPNLAWKCIARFIPADLPDV